MVVTGPALWIGGAHPEVVPVWSAALVVLWLLATRHGTRPLHVPPVAFVGLAAALVTTLQLLPSAALRRLLAPEAGEHLRTSLAELGVQPWEGLTVTPGDTAVEVARVVGLTVLLLIAAQRNWRSSATVVAGTGAIVALVGFAHQAAGATSIYGLYALQQTSVSARPGLLTPFVNPNHQASLLLLGVFCAAAIAIYEHRAADDANDAEGAHHHRDRFFAALAAVVVQLPALVMTQSRGALAVLLLLGPIAALWAWRVAVGARGPTQSSRRLGAWLFVLVACPALLAVVAHRVAWVELGSLLEVADPASSAAHKLSLVTEALGLVEWSRPVGIGRGAYVDHVGALAATPTHVLYTHVESTPVGWLVEWGWLGGTVVIGGGFVWLLGAVRRTRGRPDAAARTIALLGVAAVALHCSLEFSLEMLGVAAPFVAMVGGLSSDAPALCRCSTARIGVALTLLVAGALAVWAVPNTAAHRHQTNVDVAHGQADAARVAAMRPLDGRLQTIAARRAADSGEWALALRWATLATRQRPGDPDPWLIRSAAEHALADPVSSDRSVRIGLARLHAPPSDALLRYLQRRYPRPEGLAAVAPVDGDGWTLLVAAWLRTQPAIADAIAVERLQVEPNDATAHQTRYRIVAGTGRPSLALHHARLWRACAPRSADAVVAVARALRSFRVPRMLEARDALVGGLDLRAHRTLAARGHIEEELLSVLVVLGDAESLRQAHALGPAVLSRPADRVVQRRRERLVRALPSAS